MREKRARGAGFTLVELLVVIAIIAILMALLFPVFGAARRKARETKCMANLHDIAMAIRMYRSDEGAYPGPYDPVTGQGGLNALYPAYVASRESFICPNDPMAPGTAANGYVSQRINFYFPDGTSKSQPFSDLLARADMLYQSADGHPPFLNPTNRQWQTAEQMWSDPAFFRDHYSSYNLLYNYAGYVDYSQDKTANITKARTYTLCSQIKNPLGGAALTGPTASFLTGDSIAFWAMWYFWDPNDVIGYSGPIDNVSGTATDRDAYQRWLMLDLDRQVYWPDLDPSNLANAPADSQWRLKDDLGRALWEVDTSGATSNPPSYSDLNQEPFGVPGAVFPALMNRNAPDNTIITRCMFHRGNSRDPKTQPDIVLRLSGSAAFVPGLQGYNWAKQSELTH